MHLRPMLCIQVSGDLETTAVQADVLTDEMHRLVAAHLLVQGLAYGFTVAHSCRRLTYLVNLFLLRGEEVFHRLIEADSLIANCRSIHGSLVDVFACFQNETGDILLAIEAAFDHPAGEKENRVAFTPSRLFLPTAVDAGVAF